METIVYIFGANTLISIIFNFIFKSHRIRKKYIEGINFLQILLSTLIAIAYLSIFLSIIYIVDQNRISHRSFFSDTIFIINFVLLVAMAFCGLGIHFAAKVISTHLPEKGEIIKINFFLHMILSHFLIYSALILSLGNLALFENIHRFSDRLSTQQYVTIVALGLLAGVFHGLGFARGRSLSLFYSILSFGVAFFVYRITFADFHHLPLSVYIFIILILIGITQLLYHFLYVKKHEPPLEPLVYNTLKDLTQ